MGLLRVVNVLVRAQRVPDPGDLYQWVTGSKASIGVQNAIQKLHCSNAPELPPTGGQKRCAPIVSRAPCRICLLSNRLKNGFNIGDEPWLDDQGPLKARQALHQDKDSVRLGSLAIRECP